MTYLTIYCALLIAKDCALLVTDYRRSQKNDGSLNGNGSLKVSVLYGAKDSYLSLVIKLVKNAQNSKSHTQLLADKSAQWVTLIALHRSDLAI